MILSLVTGTYNRLPMLAAMIHSFRAQLPVDWRGGREYEIVIVDGGSNDGTLDWLRNEPDVRLIEHGQLLGAIRAFTDGARAAQGDYVLLANDDIVFLPDSILPAIAHLEDTPSCGAVAYADNRPAPGYPVGHLVKHMEVFVDGRQTLLPYAQVGMFRRWLGEACGWWGADDLVFKGHTYGGDNYLSARIYESGYSIDEAPACRVDDLVAGDGLRAHNTKIAQSSEFRRAFYKRWPRPPVYRSKFLPAPDESPRLRILYAPIFEPGNEIQRVAKRGLRQALASRGIVWEVDYLADRRQLVAAAAMWNPDVVLTQCHSVNDMTVDDVLRLRENAPNALFINWNGDVYPDHQIEMADVLRLFDLHLVVNASVLAPLRELGVNARYWQVGFEPVDEEALEAIRQTTPAHDVVFLANAYSPARQRLGEMLQALPKINVGIYGSGWQRANGNTLYDFARGRALYANAKIAISDNQYPNASGYVSNRLFEALASGCLVLQQRVPDLEHWTGLRPDEHYIVWDTFDELPKLINYWLRGASRARRQRISAAGQEQALNHHSFRVRVRELSNLLDTVLERGHEHA